MEIKKIVIALLSPVLFFATNAQVTKAPLLSAIKPSDLKQDMYELAADHFNGREAGTPDELKVSMWIAEKIRALGMRPAGDDGTFLQYFEMIRHQVTNATSIRIGNRNMKLWNDILVAYTSPAKLTDVPIVFLNTGTNADIEHADISGKAVAIVASVDEINLNISLIERRYPTLVRAKYYNRLVKKGAAAVIFVADDRAEYSWTQALPQMTRGLYDIEGGNNAVITEKVPTLWIHKNSVDLVKNNATISANIVTETYRYPSVNIIGLIEGTDPVLKKEYVLFSGHQDHDGVRQKYGEDSIYNGADDNASTCVAMFAIARAFKKQPGKRSALFVFHGAEERGLLGSKWYASHPTVPKSSIVAVLNGDMIGRNGTGEAAILGSTIPHENSADLVKITKEANDEGPKFVLDTLWDRTDHPEGFYFRSDHLPYARQGIPAIFFTSVLHSQYHTPMDEAENINYQKLYKMTEWIYRTGWKLANNAARPSPLAGFKLER